jgi:hypothetical protein
MSAQGWNRYSYAGNMPLKNIDPTGYDGVPAFDPDFGPNPFAPQTHIYVTPDYSEYGAGTACCVDPARYYSPGQSLSQQINGSVAQSISYANQQVAYYNTLFSQPISSPTSQPNFNLFPALNAPIYIPPSVPAATQSLAVQSSGSASAYIHGALAVASFAPSLLGSVASFADSLAYFAEGDRINGGIAFGAAALGVASDAGLARLGLKGAQVGADALRGIAAKGSAKGETLLYRRGPYDTKKLLEIQAAAAEESNIAIHGVSVSTDASAAAGQVVRCATWCLVEAAGFRVEKTGRDPFHYTAELPKPITPDVVRIWNELFK